LERLLPIATFSDKLNSISNLILDMGEIKIATRKPVLKAAAKFDSRTMSPVAAQRVKSPKSKRHRRRHSCSG
jgi:adenine specific DNA methylase Mod